MKIAPLIAVVFFVLHAFNAAAEQPVLAGPRVFVAGHSFSIFTAKILPLLAIAADIPYRAAGEQMIGGSRVLQHWNLPDGKNKAKEALRAGTVDVLVVSPHRVLPDPGIDKFVEFGLKKNPHLRVLVQASWPPIDDTDNDEFRNEQRDSVSAEQIDRMRKSHREVWLSALERQVRNINEKVGREVAVIVPVSEALFELRKRVANGTVPRIRKQSELFHDHFGHPEPTLALLVTYCHFATIFQRSPVGIPLPPEYSTLSQARELNQMLQEIAWEAVTQYPMSGVKVAQSAAITR